MCNNIVLYKKKRIYIYAEVLFFCIHSSPSSQLIPTVEFINNFVWSFSFDPLVAYLFQRELKIILLSIFVCSFRSYVFPFYMKTTEPAIFWYSILCHPILIPQNKMCTRVCKIYNCRTLSENMQLVYSPIFLWTIQTFAVTLEFNWSLIFYEESDSYIWKK